MVCVCRITFIACCFLSTHPRRKFWQACGLCINNIFKSIGTFRDKTLLSDIASGTLYFLQVLYTLGCINTSLVTLMLNKSNICESTAAERQETRGAAHALALLCGCYHRDTQMAIHPYLISFNFKMVEMLPQANW